VAQPDPWTSARTAAERLRAAAGVDRIDFAVVLGSGWRPAAELIGPSLAVLPTADLGGFPAAAVPGHESAVHVVDADGRIVLVFLGRVHGYEGHSPDVVVHGVRTAVFAGARTVVLTNAAGAINPAYSVGQPVLISDHLNLTGKSPLHGPPPPAGLRARFVDLSDLYAADLRSVARGVDPSLAEGVYASLPGPHYETPAEVRMLRSLGADLVGMSTALEAIAARHLEADVLGLSLVTNAAAGHTPGGHLDHAEVVAAGDAATGVVGALLARLVRAFP
jgi:purine-nucleoside phosphorylase